MHLRIFLAHAIGVAAISIAGSSLAAENQLNIGSKRFTESYILGEILKQSAQTAGEAQAVHQQGMGNTAILFNALATGAIDVYPEYTGTIAKEILKLDHVPPLPELTQRLASIGLAAGVPLGFNNTYAIAMRGEDARAKGITRLGDLAAHPEMRLGLSQEFIGRADGWPGLKAAYALPFATPRGLDHGLAYEAIAQHQVDAIDIYSTDAKLDKYGLVVLTDDRNYFPRYDAVLLYRADLPQRLPRTFAALARLEGTIDDAAMRRMNAAAELEGQPFAAIAATFVAQRGSATSGAVLLGSKPTSTQTARSESTSDRFLTLLFGADFWRLTLEHLLLVFASLAASIAIGIPLGILAVKRRATEGIILGATGLAQVSKGMRDAAQSLGLRAGTILGRIELPLAAPTIVAGIKTSAVINVGTATIAAFIGAGGYGERIVTGLALNDHAMLLAGALPAAALALLIEGGFRLADRFLVPAGIRSQMQG